MAEEATGGGTGSYHNLGETISWIRTIDPASVLDAGTGFGRWGFLVREYLELWAGRYSPEQWIVDLVGIEAYAGNIRNHHHYMYNEIHNTTIEQYFSEIDRDFELIIFGDVLEHLSKVEAMRALNKALDHGKYVLLVLPLGSSWDQTELYGNPYEQHVSTWSEEEILRFDPVAASLFYDYINRKYLVAVLSKNDPKELKGSFEQIGGIPIISKKSEQEKSSPLTNKSKQENFLHICLASYEFPPNTAGGIGTYSYYLSSIMGSAGHRVSVITIEQENLPKLPNVDYYTVAKKVVEPRAGHALASVERNRNWTLAVNQQLQKCHQRQPVDIIEITDYYGERLFLEAPLIPGEDSRVPVVTHFHNSGSFVAEINNQKYDATARSIDLYSQGLSQYRKANTQQKADYISGAIPGPNCETVKAPFIPDALGAEAEAQEFSCDFLFFGRFSAVKGVFSFANALEELAKRGHKPSVKFIGSDVQSESDDTTSKSIIEKQLKPLYGDNIEFIDELPYESMMHMLPSARVIVIPSKWESLGYTALEGFSSGRPVLCGSGVNGIYFLPGEYLEKIIVDTESARGFAEKLEMFLSLDDAALNTLGNQLRELTLEHFSRQSILDEHLDYYRSIIASNRPQWINSLEGLVQEMVQSFLVNSFDSQVKYKGIKEFSNKQKAHTETLIDKLEEYKIKYRYLLHGHNKIIQHLTSIKDFWFYKSAQDTMSMLHSYAEGNDKRDLDETIDFAETNKVASRSSDIKVFESLQKDSNTLLEFAMLLISEGKTDLALPVLKQLSNSSKLEGTKEHAIACFHLGSILKKKEHHGPAEEQLEKLANRQDLAEEIPTIVAAAHFHLGELSLKSDDPEKAISHFRSCLQLNPQHNKAREYIELNSEREI